MKKKIIYYSIAILLVAACGIFLLRQFLMSHDGSSFVGSMPDLPEKELTSVSIRFAPEKFNEGETPSEIKSKNIQLISELAALIKTAKKSPYHFCGYTGTITFSYTDNSESIIGFVPGHQFNHYEIVSVEGSIPQEGFMKINGYAYVDQNKFISLMTALGCKEEWLAQHYALRK